MPMPFPHVSPHPNRRIRVGDQEFRVDVRPGTGDGTPLLIFSGIGASLEVLQPLVDALDRSIEVIRVDVPGIGGSPAAALPYAFPQLAGLIARLLGELGHRQVDVLGYSWGGALAQQFTVQFPSKCRRLVLISTSAGVLAVPGDVRVLAKMLKPRYFSKPEEAEFIGNNLYADGGRASTELWQMFTDTLAVSASTGYFHQLAAVSTWTSLPFLPWIQQQVLILSGADDPIVPVDNAKILGALIPHSRVSIFPGGHVEIISAATVIGRQVTEFLLSPGR